MNKKIVPIRLVITGKNREGGDNRELEIYLNTDNEEQVEETIKFIKKYLKLEKAKLEDTQEEA